MFFAVARRVNLLLAVVQVIEELGVKRNTLFSLWNGEQQRWGSTWPGRKRCEMSLMAADVSSVSAAGSTSRKLFDPCRFVVAVKVETPSEEIFLYGVSSCPPCSRGKRVVKSKLMSNDIQQRFRPSLQFAARRP